MAIVGGLLAGVPAVPAVAASSSTPLCAAVRSFNAVHPTSRAEAVGAIQHLAAAASGELRSALKAIAAAVRTGEPSAVLTQANSAQASDAAPLAQAATTVTRDVYRSCRLVVHFLAAVPTGLSDEPVTPRAWGRTVCTKLVDWGHSLMNAGNSLLTPPGGVTVTLAGEQAELADFLDTSILRTQQLVNDVNEAGTPTVVHGAAIASFIRDGVVTAQRTFVAAQPAVRALPDDPHAFQVAAQGLVQTLDDTGRHVATLVHDAELRYKVRPLSRALAAEPACIGVR